ncbi:MAG: glucose 1-dehydrogenase [Candidatus Latescibacteria bacterium]|nr:glucose 1-dehydrogenase [Candidatus Latescibacterota bacterium]NIO28388.1 glucose 1-dehydrogenase [Candidatus Latescibacterota bacterium]NIO55937.1 glucose 1-dehydrogenase [Candidatus Latescibacterota bacterium]NIT01901.1 glucose 1-dehydrogenase [Candidatus Latescibacterota bacterium]
MNLENKNAIVTGGSIGIGCAIVPALARAGANVALNYRRHADEANAVVADIEKMGRRGLAVKADVSSFEDAQAMVKTVADEFGSIDILVCNAGINRDGVIWKMTEQQWDEVLDINLKGYFNYIRAVAPYFREQKSGRIINITSINAMRGKFGQSNYAASKAGIIGLTKTVARELGSSNVTVNAVAPGMIMTDMARTLDQKWIDAATAETVLGKLGDPEDVAHLVVFLASDLAGHITGQVISVDGGQYI